MKLEEYGFVSKETMKIVFAFLMTFIALDFITTSFALRNNFYETNNVINSFIVYFGLNAGLVTYFILITFSFYFIYSLNEKYNLFKYPVLFYYTAGFIHAVINNVNLLIGGL